MEKLVLIDGNSLLNRAFYATPLFTAKDGTPTNAIFGFVKLLLKLINDEKPKYLAVAFDLKAPTFRHKMYDAYKAGRKPMPDELAAQLPLLKELLALMNIECIERVGYEADDIIGAMSLQNTNVNSIIFTGDRDSYQLVNEHCEVHFTRRGVSDVEILTSDNFIEKIGVRPQQIIDVKALMGDSSDNIPGVTGIGEKTAYSLVQKFGNIDKLYQSLDECDLTPSVKNKLRTGRQHAFMSKELATIDTAFAVDCPLENCVLSMPFSAEVKNYFLKLEFRSLLLLDIFEKQQAEDIVAKKTLDVISCCDSATALAVIEKNNLFAVEMSDVVDFYADGSEYRLTLRRSLFDEGMNELDLKQILQAIFENENNTVYLYYSKDIRHKLSKYGVYVKCKIEDVSIIKYLVDYTGKDEPLSNVAEYYATHSNAPAAAIFELFSIFSGMILDDDARRLYREVELPLSTVLFEMESVGFKVDVGMIYQIGEKYKAEIDKLVDKIYESVGERFNINSPQQLGAILFDKLKLPHGKKSKTGGYSTGAEILEGLVGTHEVIDYLLQYRQKQKLYSTYIEGLRVIADRSNGIIHTTFNQVTTSTGRLSSLNPNLQNIPVRRDEGRELRKIFIARKPERVLVDADYSQIELRLLAHFSGCKELIEAYNSGGDIHTLTASQVMGVPLGEVTPSMRRSAKAVNFGIIYGISDFGLAKQLKISVSAAKSYIDRYFESYSDVKRYMESNVQFAKQNGFVKTLLGRKRNIPEIKSSNYVTRSFGERAAMNMPLQGSSADVIKLAMINVFDRLKRENLDANLILQVHDELILDCAESDGERCAKILKEEMENVVKLSVPLTVECSVGKSWFDCK